MGQVARDLARRLKVAGLGPAALSEAVVHVAAAHAEAVNSGGLRRQVEFLLEAYGPDEIETIARRRHHAAASGGEQQ
jgi:hypothetical protein